MAQALDRITPSLSGNVRVVDADLISISKHVDILAIVSDSKLIGEIRFLDIITYLYSHHTSEKTLQEVLNIPITTLMNKNMTKISIHDDFNNILQKIKDSKNKIVFVTDSDDSLCGFISISDLVPWALKTIPSESTINDHFSYATLISARPFNTIEDIVTLMIKNHIHRIVIKGEPLKIIDYRNLRSLFANRNFYRKTVKSFLLLPIKNLTKNVVRIDSHSPMQDLARLSQEGVDCFLTEKDRMITSWDIVMAAYDIFQKSKS